MDDWLGFRLLSYDPAEGHTDQLRDLSLALATAELLNRTLILPRLLWHRDSNVYTSEKKRLQLIRTRPALSALVQAHTSVPLLDNVSLLLRAHTLPQCADDRAAADGCVLMVEPPDIYTSVSKMLRRLATLGHARWLHFSSMLDVLSARKQGRYPLATWESRMVPAPCSLRYQPNVLAAARAALRRVLPPLHADAGAPGSGPGRGHYLAAHVRALRRDKFKSECPEEWLPRLVNFVNFTAAHLGALPSQLRQLYLPSQPLSPTSPTAMPPPTATLYIATDDLDAVLPRAAAALAPWRVAVVSARDAEREGDVFERRLGLDSEGTLMALDVAAVLGAHAFSPAPRSGLSVHFAAMRRCDAGALCDPAYATCVPYASSGCGGAFPRTILDDPPRCSPNWARGRYAGEPLCLDAQGVERPYFCPPGSVPPPGPRTCAASVSHLVSRHVGSHSR